MMEAWREELYHSELYHHGILGMKWGVRNGPPYPLSYYAHNASERSAGWTRSVSGARNSNMYGRSTAVGKRSVNYGGAGGTGSYNRIVSQNKNRFPTQTSNGGQSVIQRAAQSVLSSIKGKYENFRYEKQISQNEKIRKKIKDEKKKSKYRQKWEERYQKQGLSKADAEVEAYKREHTRNAIIAVGAITITAAAIGLKKRHYEDYVDKVIKKGSSMQNINGYETRGVEGAFYSSMSKSDKFKYSGFYGSQLRLGLVTDKPMKNIYKHNITATQDLKLASSNSARKVLEEKIRTDKNYQQEVIKHLKSKDFKKATPQQHIASWVAVQDVKRGKMSMLGYEGFNASLVNQKSDASRKVVNSFYDSMKKKGYDAIRDLNDARLSGYYTKSATIVFNGAKKTAVTSSVHQGKVKTYTKGAAAITGIALENVGRVAAIGAAAAAPTVGISKAEVAKRERKVVSDYRKAHPGTNLTFEDIVKMQRGTLTNAEKNANARERQQASIENYRQQHPNTKLSDAEILAMLQRKGG